LLRRFTDGYRNLLLSPEQAFFIVLNWGRFCPEVGKKFGHLWGFYRGRLQTVAWLTVWVFRRCADKRTMSSLGFTIRGIFPAISVGLLLGAALTGAIFVTESVMGWIRVEGCRSWPIGSIPPLLFLLLMRHFPTAVAEETVYRGYVLQNLEDGCGLRWAVLRSSALFGMAHLLNSTARGWSRWAVPFTLTLFGVVLASAYLVRRSLWLPIALHLSWNLFEYDVFSLAGNPVESAALLGTKVTGPEIWVGLPGSAFGPEVGLLGVMACTLGTIFLLWLAHKRQKITGVGVDPVSAGRVTE
jgi:membrane protease YdiL (CAAX protease family)